MPDTQESAVPSGIQTELSKIRSAHAEAILSVEEDPARGMYWVTIKPRSITAVAKQLRDDPALDFKLLCDLTCVDRPDEDLRFTVIYNLYSVTRNRRIFLRVRAGLDDRVPTLSGVFANANWAEREVYDLFGVAFEGHPDLRRIMMPDDWDGYPLRKDYPIVGKRPVILYNDVKDLL